VINCERNNIYHQNPHKWRISGIISRRSKETPAGAHRKHLAGVELQKSCRIGSRKEDKPCEENI